MEQIIHLCVVLAISLFSLYAFLKVLSIQNIGALRVIFAIVFSGILAFAMLFLKAWLPYARLAIMVLSLAVFSSVATKTKIDLAFTALLISIGLSSGVLFGAVLLFASIIRPVFETVMVYISTLLAIALTGALIVMLFRIRRFRKGIRFLQKKGSGIVGVLLCVAISLMFVIVNSGTTKESGVWLIIGTVLCIAGFVFWWRRGTTRLYRETVKERNEQEYERLLEEKDALIQRLREDNEVMAQVIHRDNKLLPSLYNSVVILMDSDSDKRAGGNRILKKIEQLMAERSGIILQYQQKHTDCKAFGDALLDGIVSLMMLKASAQGVRFDIAVVGDISELVDTVISSIGLETLFADLIDNAIIATKHCECKKVMVTAGFIDGIYEICVQDSGVAFEIGTLLDLGQKKTSTHLHEGGSGTGYMAIFSILRECRGSIIITEYEPEQNGFTKSVAVRFDNKCGYEIRTHRAAEFRESQGSAAHRLGQPVIISLQTL